MPSSSDMAGPERPAECKVPEADESMTQDLAPVKRICAHLNAFHVYADDPTRFVEANHYCSHLSEEVRQCILYDSPHAGARLIGIEYMITPRLYAGLDAEERRLWHSHVFEVKSGMLIMPQPLDLVAQAAWEKAETEEMGNVIELYGKVYHLWQVDKGHSIPLGEPKLMTSVTDSQQIPYLEQVLAKRDAKFAGADWRRKKEAREFIKEPQIHPDADATWK